MGPDFSFAGYQRGSAFADLNNDGFMDIVVTSLGERPRILINNGIVKNHWIIFQLRGHLSNRDAIGAKIKVVTGSRRTLYNHLTTSVGFMSSSDKRVHFGLGAETKIERVEIRWPSGITQQIDHPRRTRFSKWMNPLRSCQHVHR
jgi:enediyne biosynthesis protein E4